MACFLIQYASFYIRDSSATVPVKSSIGPTITDVWMSSMFASSFLNIVTLALYSDRMGSSFKNSCQTNHY